MLTISELMYMYLHHKTGDDGFGITLFVIHIYRAFRLLLVSARAKMGYSDAFSPSQPNPLWSEAHLDMLLWRAPPCVRGAPDKGYHIVHGRLDLTCTTAPCTGLYI